MALPLAGLRVLDLSMRLAGPLAAQLLGDMGAEVIKVEPPGGDESRRVPPYFHGVSTYYLGINRNKQSIVVDLKQAEGRAIVHGLAARCDVLLENFRPGVQEKLGIDYPTLRRLNPRLIYSSVTGFGDSGPYAQRPAYDLVAQALSGHMSVTGEAGRPPVRMGVSIGDILAGCFSVQGILAALYFRERSSQGQRVSVSLLDAMVGILAYFGSAYLLKGEVPEPTGNAHPFMVPQQGFLAADGWFVAIGHNGAFWTNFCRAIGREELEHDPRFATLEQRIVNKHALLGLLQALFASRPRAEWVAAFVRHGVPAAPVNGIAEALDDPQVLANGMILPMAHPAYGAVRSVGSPLRFSAAPETRAGAPPLLGEDTRRILAEHLNYSDAQIDDLLHRGVVAASST